MSRPRRAFAPLVWTLTAIVACTAPTPDDEDVADTSSSTDAPDTDPADSSSESEGSTTLEPGDETAADGCWDHDGELDGFDGDYGYPFEAFACSELPIPCAPVDALFDSETACNAGEDPFDLETLADPETVEASARCVLTAMRDGTPGTHRVHFGWFTEQRNSSFTVLAEGVVAFQERREDNSGYASDRYLQLRDTAWYDACLAEDLGGLMACLLCDSPVDESACIGEAPTCP